MRYELDPESTCETTGNLVLRRRQVHQVGIEAVRPQMRAAFAIDQLYVHPDLVTDPPHAAFEDVVHPKLAADLLRVDRFALVGERGISGDHETPRKTREVGRQVVGDAIDEKFL